MPRAAGEVRKLMFLDKLGAEIDAGLRGASRSYMALLQISEPGQSAARRTSTGSRSASTSAPPIRWSPRCAAAWRRCCRDEQGRALLPSVVRYLADGARRGRLCRRRRGRPSDPKNTIVSVKRFMGRGLKDVAHVENMPYDFVDAPGMVQLRTAAGVKSPVEVSAEILKVLRAARRSCRSAATWRAP